MGCASSQYAPPKPGQPPGEAVERPAPAPIIVVKPEDDPPPPYEPPENPMPQSPPKEQPFVAIGQALLCRDEFQSKYTGEWMAKWRKAKVVATEPERRRILVHYDGWSDAFDIWVDLSQEISKIAPVSLLNKEECDKGVALDAKRLQAVWAFVGIAPQASTGPEVVEASRQLSSKKMANALSEAAICPVGTMLDVLDIFYKKGSDQAASKWRKAKVVQSAGTQIRINYIGWDSKFDEDLDLIKDSRRISEFGTKSTEQMSKATVLNRSPSSANRKPSTSTPTKGRTPQTPQTAERKTAIDAQAEAMRLESDGPPTPMRSMPQKVPSSHLQQQERIQAPNSSSSSSIPRDRDNHANGKSSKKQEAAVAAVEPDIAVAAMVAAPSSDIPRGKKEVTPAVEAASPAVESVPLHSVSEDASAPAGQSKSSRAGNMFMMNPFKFSSDKHPAAAAKDQASEHAKDQPKDAPKDASASSPRSSHRNDSKDASNGKASSGSVGKSRAIFQRIMAFVNSRNEDVTAGQTSTTAGTAAGTKETVKSEEDKQVEEIMAQTAEEMKEEIEKERIFIEALGAAGLHVIEIEGDGNCLFRAVSHQLFLNEDHHEELRQRCVEHLIAHKERFAVFCPDDFDSYMDSMGQLGTWGDDLEIRALEEIIDRSIRIYSSESADPTVPINNLEEESQLKNVTALSLSYHGQNHYNSIYDERTPLPLSIRKSRNLLQARNILLDHKPKPLPAPGPAPGPYYHNGHSGHGGHNGYMRSPPPRPIPAAPYGYPPHHLAQHGYPQPMVVPQQQYYGQPRPRPMAIPQQPGRYPYR